MAEATRLERALNAARHVRSPVGRTDYDSEWLTVTVAWHLADDGRALPDRIRDILNRAAKFLRRRHGEPVLWAYAQEVSAGKARHWHLTIFVPAVYQHDFKVQFRGWATAGAFRPAPRGAVYFKAAWGMVGWKRYLLKDGTDEVRAAFNVPGTKTHARTGGLVLGKRVAVSRHLLTLIDGRELAEIAPNVVNSTQSVALAA